LWSSLKITDGARIINVSSQGHQFSPFNFEDPNFEFREYDSLSAYGQSKTAVNLFTTALDNQAKQFDVRAYSIHPGNIWGTELAREAPLDVLQQFGFINDKGEPIKEVIESLKTIQQGAATTIWAASNPLLKNIGGVYLEDINIAELNTTSEVSGGVKPYSLDENNAKQLWALSEKLTGITFKLD